MVLTLGPVAVKGSYNVRPEMIHHSEASRLKKKTDPGAHLIKLVAAVIGSRINFNSQTLNELNLLMKPFFVVPSSGRHH